MIKTTAMQLEELNKYANPQDKLSRMVASGECFQIVRGLYETDGSTPGYLLAGSIYGPSYISFEFALGYHGMIPEAVYTITSATFGKKKKKKYVTPFGTFTYRDVPSNVFPIGIDVVNEGEYYYRIACPEKALCDKLYTLKPVPNTTALLELIVNDLRMDESEFEKLNKDMISLLNVKYNCTNIKRLNSLIRRQ